MLDERCIRERYTSSRAIGASGRQTAERLMSFRETLRLRLDEIRFESCAPVVMAVGRYGEVLERVGSLTPRQEVELQPLPVGECFETVAPGAVVRLWLSEDHTQLLGGTPFFAPAARSLGLVGISSLETRQAILENGLKALALEIANALSRGSQFGSDGGGGDEAVAWLSINDAHKPGPN
ncbi:MAG: hypothetical protein JJE51_12050 [Thermoanaerobaculia bacterium]|nr:hypothetical protein [Thermoanaerobaculia bacterium]